MKILVCTPAAAGMVHYSYMMSALTELMNATERLQNLNVYDIALNVVAGNSGLSKDRNLMASLALRGGFDKLVFIDADQTWKWEQFKKLVHSPHPITAGMVALKQLPIQLNFAIQPNDKAYFDPEQGVVTPLGVDRWRADNKGVDHLQVSAVGTAFMAIDVALLSAMVQQGNIEMFLHKEMRDGSPQVVKCWDFFPSGPLENAYFGEDFGFCIQAQRAGFQVHVDTSLEIPHIGQFTYELSQGRGAWSEMYAPYRKSDA